MFLSSVFPKKSVPTETTQVDLELADYGDSEELSTFWYTLASMSELNNEVLTKENKKVYVKVVHVPPEDLPRNNYPFVVYTTYETKEIAVENKVKLSDLPSISLPEWYDFCSKIQTGQFLDIPKKICDAFLQELVLRKHIPQKFDLNKREKYLITMMMFAGILGCWIPGGICIAGGVVAGISYKEHKLKKERKLHGGGQGEALKRIALADMELSESKAYMAKLRHEHEGKASNSFFSTKISKTFDPKTKVPHESANRDLLIDYIDEHQLVRKKYNLYSVTQKTKKPLMGGAIYLCVVGSNSNGSSLIMCRSNECADPISIWYADLCRKEVTEPEWRHLCQMIADNYPAGPLFLPKVFNLDDSRIQQVLLDVLYEKKLISTMLEENKDPIHVNNGLYRDIMRIKSPQYLLRKLSEIEGDEKQKLLIDMILEKYHPGFSSSMLSSNLYHTLQKKDNIVDNAAKIQEIRRYLEDESVQSKQSNLHFNMLTILEQSILKVSLLKDNPKLCGKFLFYTPKDDSDNVHDNRSLAAIKYALNDLAPDEQALFISKLLQKYQPGYSSSFESRVLHEILNSDDSIENKMIAIKNYADLPNVIRKKDNKAFKFLSILVESLEEMMNFRTSALGGSYH